MTKRIPIDINAAWQTLSKKYKIGRSAAYRAKQKGYVPVVTKEIALVNKEEFDTAGAYRAAKCIFFKKFHYIMGVDLDIMDDMVQEAVLRIFELGGKVKEADNHHTMMYVIAKNAMFAYLASIQLAGPMTGRVKSFDSDVKGLGLYES